MWISGAIALRPAFDYKSSEYTPMKTEMMRRSCVLFGWHDGTGGKSWRGRPYGHVSRDGAEYGLNFRSPSSASREATVLLARRTSVFLPFRVAETVLRTFGGGG